MTAELYDTTIKPPKMLLIGVETDGFTDFNESLEELKELCLTCGGEVVGVITQKRDSVHPATCVGEGKLEEIKTYSEENNIDIIVFDLEMSPAQLRNIDRVLSDFDVIDRTMLILEIFAQRAQTAEGKIQVELAQMQYMLPRLRGSYGALSKLGGGGGMGARRGAGESKLELDRRYISARIDALKADIKEIQKRRNELRQRRKKDDVISIAIAGYTNSGKSTLLNSLTNAGVLAEDKLFATLDPTSRALKLPDGRNIMLIDTVGFIRRLPHHLIEAFKSTLEEVVYADLVLLMCDLSNPEIESQQKVALDILEQLKYNGPVLTVYNKIDKLEGKIKKGNKTEVYISAKKSLGFDKLLEAVQNLLSEKTATLKFLVPYNNYEVLHILSEQAKIITQKHTEKGVEIKAVVSEKLAKKYAVFTISK